MKATNLWYLKKIDLFSEIPDSEIGAIAKDLIEKDYKTNELIYTPDQISEKIHLLKKGEVTLYTSHRGKKFIIDVLTPGSLFGSINFKKENSDHFAEVSEDAMICSFSINDFTKILQQNPKVMIGLLQVMSDRLKNYEIRMKSNLLDAKEKIIHHIALIRSKNQSNWLHRISPCKHITHQKLSDYTGLTRETVTRAINDLKKAGDIKTTADGKIIVCD